MKPLVSCNWVCRFAVGAAGLLLMKGSPGTRALIDVAHVLVFPLSAALNFGLLFLIILTHHKRRERLERLSKMLLARKKR